jgi:hypothetical protein
MADYTIHDYVDKRLRYFDQQFLQEQDFIDEQSYHVSRQRLHNRALHTAGILKGLEVTKKSEKTVTVNAGAALDKEGRMIVLKDKAELTLTDNEKGKTVFLTISYPEEEEEVKQAVIGSHGNTRWHEKPELKFLPTESSQDSGTNIRLTKLVINNEGRIESISDDGVRQSAGVVLGSEVDIVKLKVKTANQPADKWPVISSGTEGQVDVQGDLYVSGMLKIQKRLLTEGTQNFPVGSEQPVHIKKQGFLVLHVEASATPSVAQFFWYEGVNRGQPAVFFKVTSSTTTGGGVSIHYRIYGIGLPTEPQA